MEHETPRVAARDAAPSADVVRRVVVALAHDRRARGFEPEALVVELKRLLAESGLAPADAEETHPLIAHAIGWAMAAYFDAVARTPDELS
jgi:hypothetical protein